MANELPGQREILAVTPRKILWNESGNVVVHAGGVIDATYAIDGANTSKTDELRAGWLMARITASKLWVPLKRTQIATPSLSASVPSALIYVDNAAAFKAGDTVTVNATTGLTVDSVNYTTNVITLTTSIDVDLAVGDPVFASGDLAGAEIARGVLASTVRLLSGIPFDTTERDKAFQLLIAGCVDNDQVLGDLTAALESGVTNYLSHIIWRDQQGQD